MCHLSREKKTDFDRIKDMVLRIKDDGSLSSIDSDITNIYAEQTLYKLTSFNYYQYVYCQVMKNQKKSWLKKCYYIDLMAGSGLTKILDRNIFACGSSVLAAKNSLRAGGVFDKIICVELDEERAKTLEKRMHLVYPPEKVVVINDAAENVIPSIIDEIRGDGVHFLACVDYQNTQGPGFDDISPLLKMRGDAMMTFMVQALWRAIGQSTTGGMGNCEAIHRYLGNGCDEWREAKTESDLLSIYCDLIRECDRTVVPVNIKSENSGFHFHTCFSCKNKKSGSPYLQAAIDLDKFYTNKPDILRIILDNIENKQQTLF